MKGMVCRSAAVVLLFWQGLSANVIFKPLDYQARFELLSGMPKVTQGYTLALTVKAFQDLPNTSVHLSVPEGLVLVNGQQSATVNLNAGDSIVIPYVFRTLRPGAFRVDACISPAHPDSLHWEEGASYYIVSRLDTAFHSDARLPGFIYNIGSVGTKLPPTLKGPYSTLRVSGTVRYKNYDSLGYFTPLPDVEMLLADVGGGIVGSWHTDDNGWYDQTFSDVAYGVYFLIVLSRNSAAEVHGFPFGDAYHLALLEFAWAGGEEEWSPNIEGHPDGWYFEDVCQILVNTRKSKNWAQERFSYTLDFMNVKHPLPHYLTSSCYVPRAHSTFPGGPTVPGTDAIYIKYGTWVQPHNDIWGHYGRPTTSHEWAHAFMMKTFEDKVPVGLGFSVDGHWFNTVSNSGFAFGEGFAEWMGPAVWLDVFEDTVDEGASKLEDYYPDGWRHPWWKGEDDTCTDGRIVEGANMQVFWDLFDEQSSNDHSADVDDDGISNQCYQIGQTLKKIKQDISYFWSFEHLPVDYGWLICGWVKRAHIHLDTFRTLWYEQEYPRFDEIYDVNLFGTKPPAPTGLSVTGRGLHYVDVEWTDHSRNEGMFLVRCRPSDSQQYLDELPQQCQPSTGTGQSVNYRYENSQLQSDVTYELSVAALTCDTSAWSDEAEAPPIDASCIAIDAPLDSIHWGTDVTPSARTYNSGSFTESYAVRMRIINESSSVVYDTTASVIDHEPQDTAVVTFPTWHADQHGEYAVTCSTELAGDGVPSNDRMACSCVVPYARDVSADSIASLWRVGYYEELIPVGLVSNNYDQPLTFMVKFVIDTVYRDSNEVTVPAGQSIPDSFGACTELPVGEHQVQLIVVLTNDDIPSNDTCTDTLLVADNDYWVKLMPPLQGIHQVLVEGRDQDSAVFALRRDSNSVAKYSVPLNMWDVGIIPTSSPLGAHYSADRYGDIIFALGSMGMQPAIATYNIALNQWSPIELAPAGFAENGGIFARHTDTAYVLLGGIPARFYRYIVSADTWIALNPPLGLTTGLASSTYDDGGFIHVLEVQSSGSPTRGLLETYDINLGIWGPTFGDTLYALQPMNGTAITTLAGRNSIFALWPTPAGTQFWDSTSLYEFDLLPNQWQERWIYFDSVGPFPSMTPSDGLIYASCFNSATTMGRTFGRYYPIPMPPGREGTFAAPAALVTVYGLNSVPNPFTQSTTIHWQVPKATSAQVAVYDVQGRLVKKLHDGNLGPGRYSQVWDTQRMPAGVYLCSFASNERRLTQRLILIK